MQWDDRIGRRVKLRDLHVLLAVAESGGMARAANRLAISQPVVSKTISDLEHALGVRLLDRTSQGIEPTAYGRVLLTCGTAVFDELRRGAQEIEFLSDPTKGKLSVGGAGPFIDSLIPAVVSRLADRYPRIEFHVAESDAPTLCRILRERKLDLVICRTSSSFYTEDLASDHLFDEPMVVVAGVNNRWSRRRRIDLAELLDEPWTMPESDNVARTLIAEGFCSVGMAPPTPQVVSNSMTVRMRLVETGRFLTILPVSTLYFGGKRLQVKILPIVLPMKSPPTEIITLKNRTPNAIARLFTDELRTFAKQLAKSSRERGNASGRGKRAILPVPM